MKPGDDRELCLIAADQMSEAGHWDDAVELYLKAESLAPKKPKLDAKLAPAFAGAGKYAESTSRYRRLLETAPNDAELRNNFAWTLMESGDVVRAEEEFRTAMRLSPHESRAAVNLGVLLARQKRYDEALAILTSSIGEPAAHHNIGVVAIEAGDEATAVRAFEKAVSLPGAPKASVEFLASLKSNEAMSQSLR
jgi:Flp pilus assembly protein TadD